MKKKSKRKTLTARRKKFDKRARDLSYNKDTSLNFLAAGVAHEFNNLLGAAHGHARWALDSGKTEDLKAALEVVENVCIRSSLITKALQSFAQPREESFVVEPLEVAIKQAFALEEGELKSANVDVELKLSPHCCEINSSEIIEVFLNLIRNSLDAFLDFSSIEKRKKILVHSRVEAGLVKVFYSDNGPGIDQVYAESIFQPFWTTKGVLRNNLNEKFKKTNISSARGGTGLGLFLCRRIAREHGGELSVIKKSTPGASFLLSLPFSKGSKKSK